MIRYFSWLNIILLFLGINVYAQVVEDNTERGSKEVVADMLLSIQVSALALKEKLYEHVTTLNEVYRDLEQVELEKTALMSFYHRQGRLPWPVSGHIRHGYGTLRIGSERWNGVYIETRAEETVRVPHAGKVVFADNLRGFGLLMIIEHQDGYMTLYGNNTSLFRKTGDIVQAGDTISTTGFGPEGYGLYFEIRRYGLPVNPKRWLLQR